MKVKKSVQTPDCSADGGTSSDLQWLSLSEERFLFLLCPSQDL